MYVSVGLFRRLNSPWAARSSMRNIRILRTALRNIRRERLLFIGTQFKFSNLYTAVDTPAGALRTALKSIRILRTALRSIRILRTVRTCTDTLERSPVRNIMIF